MFSRALSLESLACDRSHGVLGQVGAAARAALWTGEVFSTPAQGVGPTGFAKLDAELPGGGWPGGGLIEILQDEGGEGRAIPMPPAKPLGDEPAGALAQRLIQRWALAAASGSLGGAPGMPAAPGAEWRLLLPALAGLPGGVTLIGPPAVPHAAALAQAGLALDDLVWVQADTPARRLWAAEQVLRAGLPGATLVWLPWASAVQLRRLQMAALASPGLVFVMRPAAVAAQSSPAPLRLLLRSPRHDTLAVRVFKRRGPPAGHDLQLTAWPPGLEQIITGHAWISRHLRQSGEPAAAPRVPQPAMPSAGAWPHPLAAEQCAIPGTTEAAAARGVSVPAMRAAPATEPPALRPDAMKEQAHVVAGLASA